MTNNKKMFIYIGIALILVSSVAVGTVLLLKSSSQNKTSTTQKVTQETADNLKLNAITVSNSDPTKAKALLEQALDQYKELSDDHNVVDTTAQLKILEYQTNHE